MSTCPSCGLFEGQGHQPWCNRAGFAGLPEALQPSNLPAQTPPSSAHDRTTCDFCRNLPRCPHEIMASSAAAPLISREQVLKLAHQVGDIACGNDRVVDEDHDVNRCEVCNRIADLMIDFFQSSAAVPAKEEKAVEIANALAEWINATPLPPSDIHPVYDAHVLLCEMIRRSSAAAPAKDGIYLSAAQIEQVMNALEGWDGKDAEADENSRRAAFETIQEACEPWNRSSAARAEDESQPNAEKVLESLRYWHQSLADSPKSFYAAVTSLLLDWAALKASSVSPAPEVKS